MWTGLVAAAALWLLAGGQALAPARKRSPLPMTMTDDASVSQMQSRAVDTRVTFEIAEGRPRGTLVGRIPVKPDFTYRFNEPPREFSLDPSTGEIRTDAELDRETIPTDRFDLVVLSSQPTYPIEVRIIVLDVNDNGPRFPEPSIAVAFSESAAPGTRLLLDAANDLDAGTNGVSDDYRIVDGNEGGKFTLVVTASYLHLETTGRLDREQQASYVLNVSARDGGRPPLYGYLLVNVTILDVNDNPPMFDHSDYSVSLNESVPPGTPVLPVVATDADAGDNARITYYLADGERRFAVDPDTGVISTTEPLDCPRQSCPNAAPCPRSCVFTVFARDHGSPRQDGRTYVTVNLVDANDHDPIIRFRYFPPTAAHATVDENALNGSVVAAVSVVDADDGPNGDTDVRILTGNERRHFRLDRTPSFHIVRVNGVLDREDISVYNLTVVATDKGAPPRTATAFLVIHVNDVNDHEPVFDKSEYSAVLGELAPPGTYVAGITATDEDTGVNAQIYYAFVSGNDRGWFKIDPDSGLITTRAPLDREIEGTVELRVSARDGGPNPKWAHTHVKVTILDENDEAPRFSQPRIEVALSEASPAQTLVAMLAAADHDQGTNGSVTYSLHPTVQRDHPDVFGLDSLTGQLTTRTRLDRERVASYRIRVVARDQGVPPQSSTATVTLVVQDVNDNAPRFYPGHYHATIPDNSGIGTSVLTVVASDSDEGNNAEVTYGIESGSDGLFAVGSRSGVVTVIGDPRDSPASSFELKISATDGGGKRATQDATVELTKERLLKRLEFDRGLYEFRIVEDHGDRTAQSRRTVGRVRVIGSGAESVRYSIVFGDPEGAFDVDARTGEIVTAGRIDREWVDEYRLTVVARSGGAIGRTTVQVTVLDLNDNRPTFLTDDGDDVRLPENAAVGQEVYAARAADKDDGVNSRLTYALTFNPDGQFRIGETTGVVYLARPIRADPGTTLGVEVTATDSGEPRLSSKNAVSITIVDVNDHTPVFDHTSYETSLLESAPVNARFFALSASDADLGANGRVSYAITDGDPDGKFGVFPDGYLYVRSPLDREKRDYYSLTVAVADSGSPPRSSVVPVVIHVIDENDNPPKFTNTTFTFSVRENEPPDSFVGKLTASDRDIGRNAELIFSLLSSQDFAVDPKNGFVKTLRAFDREELVAATGKSHVTLEAAVTDNGSPRLRDKVKVDVHVTDVNDNAPKFLRAPYRVQISEGSQAGAQVVRLYTSDADEGLNGDVFYGISAGNEEGRFAVDEATGQVTLSRTLDRETTAGYALTVVAYDAGTEKRLSSSTTVRVDVLDENDNAPEFAQTSSNISVLETAQVGTELVRFRATDADLGINSVVTFSIGSGNRRDTFNIDSATGALYLHRPLDYEELSGYQLNVTASDGGNPRLSTTVTLSIVVVDANDNPPSFPNTAIVRQIKEGISTGTPLHTVNAEDPDSGRNGQVEYSISSQEPDDSERRFGIDPTTGVIHTLLEIDRERVDTFRLTVVATDRAEPKSARLSAEKLVTVIVEDVNDNAPVFVSMNAALLSPEHVRSSMNRDGYVIMHVFARDLDSSTNGLVTYELVSGDEDVFRLHRTTGALSLRRPLFEPRPRYQLAVKATDEAVQSERRSTEAYVTVISASDFPGPIFESPSFSGSVYENEPPGSSILKVGARFDGVPVEYYVTNVTGNGRQVDRLFDIDAKLGVLSTAVELDRESGVEAYEIEVYAIASEGHPRTSKTKVS